MLLNHIVASTLSFFAGVGVSAGTFAFILVIGVIPRILKRLNYNNIIVAENIIVLGVIWGNIMSVYDSFSVYEFVAGAVSHIIIIIYGLSVGIFVGCVSVALAEILHTFPIIMGRFGLHRGLKIVISAMAFGKTTGCILYFLFGYAM